MTRHIASGSNLLEVLGVAGREDAITNVLVHCYNNSANFRLSFIRSLGLHLMGGRPPRHAYSRVQIQGTGVPDMIIVDPEYAHRTIVVIENKLGAGEGPDQTKRYSSPQCLQRLFDHFGLDAERTEAHYVFLTLFPDEVPKSSEFAVVPYEAFLRQKWVLPRGDGTWVRDLMCAWLDVLKRFYGSARLLPDERFLDRLRRGGPLDGSFLAFRSFMRSVRRPRDLFYLASLRSNKAGRWYYLAQLGKKHWSPSLVDQSMPEWRLDPRTCFNLHIEPQFSVLNGDFSLYLHYETNPYLTRKETRLRIHKKDYEAYVERRDRFISALRDTCPEGFKVCGGTNQVAEATVSFEGLSVTDASGRLSDLFRTASKWVDKTLREVDRAQT